MEDIKAYFKDPDNKKYPNEDFVYELSNLLENFGLYNPLEKIYLSTKNITDIASLLFLFVVSQFTKLTYLKTIGKYESKII